MILLLVCTVIPGISTEAAGYYNSAGAKLNVYPDSSIYQHYIDDNGNFCEWTIGKLDKRSIIASNIKDYFMYSSGNDPKYLLTRDGRLYVTSYYDDWYGNFSEVTIDTGVNRILSLGYYSTPLGILAIKNDNSLWSYTCDNRSNPADYRHASTKLLDSVSDAICTGRNLLALKTDGSVWQSGDGVTDSPTSFVKIMDNAKSIAMSDKKGVTTAYAITKNNDLYSWGDSSVGKLGRKAFSLVDPTPGLVMKNVSKVSTNVWTTLVITEDSKLYIFGSVPDKLGKEIIEEPELQDADVFDAVMDAHHYFYIKKDNSLWENANGVLHLGAQSYKPSFNSRRCLSPMCS